MIMRKLWALIHHSWFSRSGIQQLTILLVYWWWLYIVVNSHHNAACLLHPRSIDIRLFSLHSDGKLFEASDAVVSLSNPVRNCTLDDSDRLWVCVQNEQEPLQCFRVGNGKVCTWTLRNRQLDLYMVF